MSKLPTDVKPLSKSKKQYQKLLAEYRAEIAERGRIGIFDRSYYEEVADRARRSRSPSSANACPKSWPIRKRFGRALPRPGEPGRLPAPQRHPHHQVFPSSLQGGAAPPAPGAIDTPDKNWTLSRADIEIRRLWDKFQSTYEDCLSATSSEFAPWYAVPADEKRNARLIVSQIIVETMKSLRMDYPVADKRHLKELKQIKRALQKEKK